jgi:hypothetical protein
MGDEMSIIGVNECLTLIQFELKAPKNQYNSFGKYKYRNCEDIQEAVKPLLQKYGATLVVQDEVKECRATLVTLVVKDNVKEEVKECVSMPYIESTATFMYCGDAIEVKAQAGIDINRKGMDVAQCFGASSSYARKYCLTGLFLLDDTKDADATNTHGKDEKPVAKQQDTIPLSKPIKLVQVTDEQVDIAIESGKMMVLLENVGVKYSITQEQRVKLENALNNI